MKVTLKTLAAPLLVLLLTGCSTVSTSHAPLEYRVDQVGYGPEHHKAFLEHLNAIARDGWVLVQFGETDYATRVVASRPKPTP